MKKTLVVNLFGVPGSGKSTGAAYIFSKLKLLGMNAELVTEFAKDLVWDENKKALQPDNQCYLFGTQYYKIKRCINNVDVIITDSPLPLSILYNKETVLGESFNETVMNCFNSFYNYNYLINRTKKYNPHGRLQTEEESDALLPKLKSLMDERDINYKNVDGNENGYNKIVKDICDYIYNI